MEIYEDIYVKMEVNGKRYETCPPDNKVIVDRIHGEKILQIHARLYWQRQGYCNICYRENNTEIRKSLHRFILELEGVPIEQLVVHHKNNNKYDNRLDNLEPTTSSHNNSAFHRKTPYSSSIYKGVSFEKKKNKWACKFQMEWLGYFDSEKEAAVRYDQAFFLGYKSTNGSNELLSEEDKEFLLDHPIEKKQKKCLPKNIHRQDNSYKVKFDIGPIRVCKQFKHLEDAIKFKDEYLQKREKERLQAHIDKEMTRNEDGVATISVKITGKEESTCALVDDEDYFTLARLKWVVGTNGYAKACTNPKNTSMHAFLLKNKSEKSVIDHINTNKMDNRKQNLRLVSRSFNARNKKRGRETKSGYQGVTWNKRCQSWTSRIHLHGKETHLGRFKTAEEASLVYQLAYQALEEQEMENSST